MCRETRSRNCAAWNGLRVVDASIMPIVPSANTNAPSIMVMNGEKGSQDLILGGKG